MKGVAMSYDKLIRHQAEDVWLLEEKTTLMEEMGADRSKDMEADASFLLFYRGTGSILTACQLVDGQGKSPTICNDFY